VRKKRLQLTPLLRSTPLLKGEIASKPFPIQGNDLHSPLEKKKKRMKKPGALKFLERPRTAGKKRRKSAGSNSGEGKRNGTCPSIEALPGLL